jgi:catechol 2,3-dioxygenase-like lactoylglutathione lyase family enzyme
MLLGMADWTEPDEVADRAVFDDVAPVLPVTDLPTALERYRGLGFRVRAYGHGTGYGYAERDGVALHLSEWDRRDPGWTGSQVYLFVADADAVHAEWTASGVAGRFTDPHDTEYGRREFAFVDPDGTLHRVGSPLP